MKVSLFFLVIGTCCWANPNNSYAQKTEFSLAKGNKTLQELFTEIEEKSEFIFLYNDNVLDLSRKVNVDDRKYTLPDILDKVLEGSDISYNIVDRQVILYKTKDNSLSSITQQSGRKLTGKVVDKNGEALPGATILVVGSPRGVFADENGNFEMDNVAVGTKLSASLLGMQTKPFEFQGKGDLIIVLEENINELDEVTIVAFGKQKKSSVVASIETVKASDLRVPASNLTASFAGKIPGLISYQTSGEPGLDNAQFFVRGVTTFGYATSPLILIDGFESTSDNLARMQPDDIESFSILKDASASVLYGSRGANGIILVTTKSGQEGSKVKINARVDVNVTTPTKMLEMIDGIEYMQLYNQARVSRDPERGVYYPEQKIQATKRGDNPMIYPNVNWYDMLFNKQTTNTKANLNISGGGKVANYFVSASYDNETGLLKVDKRNNFNNNINIDRFNLRNNVIFKLSSSTTLDTRLQARYEKYTGPSTSAGDIFYMVIEANPVDFPAVFEPDEANRFTKHTLFGSSTIGTSGLKRNPYAEMVRGYQSRDETTVTAQVTLLQDLDFITKGLKFQAKASASTWSIYGNNRSYKPFYYNLESYNQITGIYRLYNINKGEGDNTLGNVETSRNSSVKYYFEARANWDRTFGRHSVSAMTVLMVQENLFTTNVGSGDIFSTLPERNVGNSGRLTYDFDDRYFLEFGYGYNGSEKFTGSKQFGFFPSLGAGWLVSNEQFWTPLKDAVDLLKLKFTWGLVGNDAIAGRADRFHFLSNITKGGAQFIYGENLNVSYNGYQIKRYANPNIGWEVSEKYNLGLELGLLKGAPLKLNVDFFKDFRRNIYMERTNFPNTGGLEATVYGNVGEMESQGIDGSIDYQKFFNKDFWMTGRVNVTYAKNKYVQFDEPNYTDTYRYRVGHSAGQQWGLVAERLFVDDYEVESSPTQNFNGSMPQAGDIKYVDINHDGKVDSKDQIAMGFPTTPEMQYGFGLSAGYKKFDMSFFFQGNARVSFFIDPTKYGIAPFENRRNALAIVARGSWSETNPDVHAFWPRLSVDEVQNNTQQSSWWLRDGSFVRLKTLEAGYNFPGFKKLGLENFRAYLSIENLFVISAFKQWDPEMGRSGMGYPLNRRFNVGLQLSF
ncbi:SusC/RagA family TonB-linked outer membrane protein [Bacteroidia bacterium]|nr:SusC/RagA family TonB-linked outer membrane protein [Bacteroidia bacterium]